MNEFEDNTCNSYWNKVKGNFFSKSQVGEPKGIHNFLEFINSRLVLYWESGSGGSHSERDIKNKQ
jgi:hypothetical protein